MRLHGMLACLEVGINNFVSDGRVSCFKGDDTKLMDTLDVVVCAKPVISLQLLDGAHFGARGRMTRGVSPMPIDRLGQHSSSCPAGVSPGVHKLVLLVHPPRNPSCFTPREATSLEHTSCTKHWLQ